MQISVTYRIAENFNRSKFWFQEQNCFRRNIWYIKFCTTPDKTTPISRMPLLDFEDITRMTSLASLMEAGRTESDKRPSCVWKRSLPLKMAIQCHWLSYESNATRFINYIHTMSGGYPCQLHDFFYIRCVELSNESNENLHPTKLARKLTV